jgi:superfamily II helicase
VKKLSKVIREFDENVELEKEIIAEKASNDGWMKKSPLSNIEDEMVGSTVDSNKLLEELGGGFTESSSMSGIDDLLDEMGDN